MDRLLSHVLNDKLTDFKQEFVAKMNEVCERKKREFIQNVGKEISNKEKGV